MKIGFILIILFFLIASSCQNNKVVKLSGEIKGVNSNPLLISDLKFMDSLDTLAVDTVFNITMDVDNACFRTLIFGSTKKEIFLAPGYSLKIFFDANNIYSSLSFDGEGTNENRIHDSISRSMNKINFDFIYNQPSDLAVKYINSLFSSYQKYFNRLVSVTNLDPLFIDFEKQKMTYFFATLKENIGSNAHISNPVFYSFFDTLYIENEKYLEISEYRNFLSSYIDFKANKILNWRDRSEDEFYDDYLDACLLSILQVKNKKIREYLFFSQISFFIETNGVKNLTKFYQYFTKYNTNYIYAKQIQIIFDRKQLLSKGKKAPDFTLTDIDGNRVSLLKFRGKYVYRYRRLVVPFFSTFMLWKIGVNLQV
jgi:hypothetical protein